MTTQFHTLAMHAGTCAGHCRAQRFAMDAHCALAFEAEKAAITSYEDGWDRWDGPVWPWRHTNVPQAPLIAQEEGWEGCCAEVEGTGREERVVGEAGKADTIASANANANASTNTMNIKRPVLPRQHSAVSNASEVSNVSLWTSGSVSPCPNCGSEKRLGEGARL